jgi:hypothetical protein
VAGQVQVTEQVTCTTWKWNPHGVVALVKQGLAHTIASMQSYWKTVFEDK